MSKPTLLLHGPSQWQPSSLRLAQKYFDVQEWASSDHLHLRGRQVVLHWPKVSGVHYLATGDTEDVDPLCIISNTTSESHLDAYGYRQLGIPVFTLKGQTDFLRTITSTAEHTLGLLCAAHRRTTLHNADVLRGEWNRRLSPPAKNLSEMILAIIGYGNVGSHLRRMADPLFHAIRVYDPYKRATTLKATLQGADALAICCALTPETYQLIRQEHIDLLNPGSILVNTAQAEILNHYDLLKSLDTGHLHCAALDKVDHSWCAADMRNLGEVHQHMKQGTLIVTPHIGGATLSSWAKTEQYVLQRAINHLGLDRQGATSD